MEANQERILVVGSDPVCNDLVARQTLQPLGYQVRVVPDVLSAIRETALPSYNPTGKRKPYRVAFYADSYE